MDTINIEKNDFKEKFVVYKGILLRTSKNGDRIVAPKSLLLPMIYTAHYSISPSIMLKNEPGCHTSPNNMYKIISEKFWHPELMSEITKFASNCLLCMVHKVTTRKSALLGTKNLPNMPREVWCMDIASGITECNGFKYIVIYVDMFSLYSVIIPLRSRGQEEFLKVFKNHICSKYSFPKCIYGDKEGSFMSDNFKHYCQSRNIEIRTSQRDAHWSNGIAETGIRILKQFLRLCHQHNGHSWLHYIDYINNCINNRLLSSGYTPHELFFGCKKNNSLLLNEFVPISTTDQEHMDNLMKQQEVTRDNYMKIRNSRRNADRVHQNKKRKLYVYKEGDIVLLRDLTSSHGGSSMTPRYIGPYVISELDNSGYTVKLISVKDSRIRHAHIEYLKSIPADAGIHTKINMNVNHLLPNNKCDANVITEKDVLHTYNLRSKTTN